MQEDPFQGLGPVCICGWDTYEKQVRGEQWWKAQHTMPTLHLQCMSVYSCITLFMDTMLQSLGTESLPTYAVHVVIPRTYEYVTLHGKKDLGIIIQLRIFEKREAPELFRCHQEGPYKKRAQRLESREEIMTMEMEAKQNFSEGSCKWWGQAASVSWET